jgi:copper transport protein
MKGREWTSRRLAVALRIGVLAAIFAALAGLAAPAAQAHAFLESSSPADGSSLREAPTSLKLTFSEEVLQKSSWVTLRAGDGSLLLDRATATSGDARPDVDAAESLVIALPRLGTGSYSATWHVQSSDDVHVTAGTVSFAVGQPAVGRATGRGGPGPGVISSLIRWSDLFALCLLTGSLLLMTTIRGSRLQPLDRARLKMILWRVAGAAALGAALVGVGVLWNAADGSGLESILATSRFGRLWLLRECSLGLVVALCALGSRGAARVQVAAALATGGAVAAIATASHVGSGADRPLALALLVVHVAAAIAWTGAVVLLAAGLLLNRWGRFRPPLHPIPVLRSFAVPAVGCVGLAVVTGIALTGRQVASVDALLTTTYGQILLAKVLLVTVAGWFGLRTSRRLRRPRGTGAVPLRRIVAEAAVLVAVLLAAAAMSVGTPARGPAFAERGPAGAPLVSGQVHDLLESAALAPNAVGPSWLRVDVNQTRRPPPAPITAVQAVVTGPDGSSESALTLLPTGIDGRWEVGGVDLTTSGSWLLTIVVHRTGRPDSSWSVDWVVPAAGAGASPPTFPDRPWRAMLDAAALTLAGLLTVAMVLAWQRGRRRPAGDSRVDAPSNAGEPVLTPL